MFAIDNDDKTRQSFLWHVSARTHRVTEEAVVRHLVADDAGEGGSGVDPDSNLDVRLAEVQLAIGDQDGFTHLRWNALSSSPPPFTDMRVRGRPNKQQRQTKKNQSRRA